MRKVISILLISFMLLAGMHLSVASHVCGGKNVAQKISFSEQLATCGMESDISQNLSEKTFQTDCCHNHILVLSIDQNYESSDFETVPSVQQFDLLVMPINGALLSFISNLKNTVYTNANSFEDLTVEELNLSRICVFLI